MSIDIEGKEDCPVVFTNIGNGSILHREFKQLLEKLEND